ncbi:hypothetical protein [Caenispirillum bisanense]|uniref:Uncharacterized protein n=1 Tax=Caenispirillum bisanense TaxID=414052 RepID=A0A286GNU8_9PROT|nr:hypothetical protein [Caenispirillum bisanense]SOD96644.1 hypothetical protein SAMN05421508_10620 [Caenispirillum bisanense]
MTVSNIYLEPHRVRIQQDTVQYYASTGKPAALVDSKTHVLPDAPVAVACRGLVHFSDYIESALKPARSFDEAVALAETAYVVADFERADGKGFETTIAGVDANGTARAVVLWAPGDGSVTRTDLTPGSYLRPDLGDVAHLVKPDLDDERLFRVALVQQKVAHDNRLLMTVGGSCTVVEITRDGVKEKVLGDYPGRSGIEAQLARREVAA